MKTPRFTHDSLRAAFQLRSAGTPHPDLRRRIRDATRLAVERPALVVTPGTRSRRPLLARFAAISAVAAALAVAQLAGVGSAGPRGLDPLVRQPIPEDRTAVAVATEDDEDDPEDDDHEKVDHDEDDAEDDQDDAEDDQDDAEDDQDDDDHDDDDQD